MVGEAGSRGHGTVETVSVDVAGAHARKRKVITMETLRSTNPKAEEILGRYFPVLDNGFVALVDYMGTDDDVERAARVSYGAGTRKTSQTRGLIRYLRRHKHSTPSEMIELKFHCAMPIFIARQWIRHRTANVNEMSGRYSLLPMVFYTPEPAQLQVQSKSNNQGRSGDQMSDDFYAKATGGWSTVRGSSQQQYEWLTSHDVARELARIDLPLSTYTQWYWKIDLHNLMHFLTLRVDAHAQWEIREYGKVMAGMMKRVAPLSYEAWIDYDVTGARFSRMELAALRTLVAGDTDRIFSRAGGVEKSELLELGFSDREVTEFVAKISKSEKPADFELDLAAAKTGAYFEERFAAAVPKGDAPPTS
jgi:thymidylate synthase (FAD)